MIDPDIELDPQVIKPYESDDFELGQACSVIDPECEACT